MKKLCIFLIFFICLTSSCSGKPDTDKYEQAKDDYFIYNIDKDIYYFDINEKNELYYISSVDNTGSETINSDSGKNLNKQLYQTQLNILDTDGKLINSYILPDLVSRFCIYNDDIYYLYSRYGNYAIAKYSTASKSSIPICNLYNYTFIKKMKIVNNMLYFIGSHKDYLSKNYSLADIEDNFSYSGERIACVNLDTGTIEDIDIDFPIMITANPDNRHLVIYAYDESNGFYFTVYDTDKKSCTERIYRDLGMMFDFEVFNKNNEFIYSNVTRIPQYLSASSLSADEGIRELLPAGYIMYTKCTNDYIYFIDAKALQKIIRIKISSYLQGNKKITMLHSDFYITDTPFGCGYTIENKYLTDEELAINILSQDQNFDICTMNSWQTISANVRKNAAFYPLNDVDGVKEYLDLCFPYIKECAINDDGDIWMLPIYVDIPFFVYNDELCQKHGIQFSNSMNTDYFYQVIDQIKKNDSLRDLYYYFPGRLTFYMFYQYLREYKNFDTDIFKNLAQNIKQFDNEYTGNLDLDGGNFNLPYLLFSQGNTDFLFSYFWDANDVSFANNQLNACSIPYLTDNKTNVATCYFLFVNPASKNLKEALQYISSLCHYLTSAVNEPYLIFNNRSLYPDNQLMDDIFEIYSNGDIQFTYPDELYLNNFHKYLKGEMDLESFIKDSNNRLDMFLNE